MESVFIIVVCRMTATCEPSEFVSAPQIINALDIVSANTNHPHCRRLIKVVVDVVDITLVILVLGVASSSER
jgi:hypothetical protein